MQSRMWRNYLMMNMRGYDATLDQCAYGLRIWKNGVLLGPAKKQTRIRTTNYHFAIGISKKCKCAPRPEGGSPHVHLEGMGPILRQAQNYPKQLCKRAALLIVVTSFCDLNGFPSDSHQDDVLALEETVDEFE